MAVVRWTVTSPTSERRRAIRITKPYWTSWPKRRKANLPEVIKAAKWDIVTIQQASPVSWDKSKTLPAADELIAYIRKNAPQAEIVIHQTWSYRNDDSRISGAKPVGDSIRMACMTV